MPVFLVIWHYVTFRTNDKYGHVQALLQGAVTRCNFFCATCPSYLPSHLSIPLLIVNHTHPPAVGSLARLFECWFVMTELDPFARWMTVQPTSRAPCTRPLANPLWQCLFNRPVDMVTVKQYSASISLSELEQVAISFWISRTGMTSSTKM